MSETIIMDAAGPVGEAYAPTVLGDSPSLYWRLGESSGTTANDETANNNDGTYGAGVTLGETGALFGDADTAVDIASGATGVVTCSYSPFAAGSVRTFEGWANLDTTGPYQMLFTGTGATGPYFYVLAGSTDVRFNANNAAGGDLNWASAISGAGAWFHWVLIVDQTGDTAELFINGVSKGVLAHAVNYSSPGNFNLGHFVGLNYDGKMDEVAVYERALTSTEVQEHYTIGTAGPVSTPAAFPDRTALDISSWVSKDGIDWGDAQMVAYMSEQAVGSSPADFRIPNRQITIPLALKAVGGTAFGTIRSSIQSRIGQWQQQGGQLKRVLSDASGTVFCDVVTAQLHLGGDWLQAHRDADVNAAITLEAIPDFYEAEETLSDHTETTLPEITFTETTANGGDFPLGDRVRVVVDEDGAQSQRGMFWAWRGRHYSSASTAASAYEAEALQTLDTATKVAKAGASGGTVVTHGTLSTNWTPVVGTNMGGTTYLTHTGTNRIYARVFSTAGTTVQSRFVWDVGDLVLPSENDAVRLYDGGTFHILDLGEVRLDPTPTGTHRWQGMIQAKGDAGAEAFSVDRVWIVNRDESAGVLQAPTTLVQGLATYSARSEFATESGTITGDALAVGGTWVGAGDGDDFSVVAGVATRMATNDTTPGIENGRLITASTPTTLTNTAARVDFKTAGVGTLSMGVVLRYTNISNFVVAVVSATASGIAPTLNIYKRVAGTTSTVASGVGTPILQLDTWYTIEATVDASGQVVLYYGVQNRASRQLAVTDSALATGGALASGSVGVVDYNSGAGSTRSYDNFAAWAPTFDAVAFASQSVELNTQGITREDTGGTAWGPVSVQAGDIPRMPNRASAGTVEFVGKLTRGDFISLPDPGVDDISARVYRRASHLLIPS